MEIEKLSFREIENLAVLKRFQDLLFNLTGLVFDFVDKDAKPSAYLQASAKYSRFCHLIQSSPAGLEACKECDIRSIRDCVSRREPVIYKCHLDLTEILVPLVIGESVLGCLTSGQFMTLNPGKKEFQRRKKTINSYSLDSAKAERYFRQLPVLKREKVEAVVELISIIGEYIIEMENKIIVLRESLEQDRIQKARGYARLHFREQIHIKDIAAFVSLSPSRFAHLFKERTNNTFLAYLNELRIDNAKNLLANTELKILHAAYESGFSNLSSFNRIFKEKTGFSPVEYRKKQKKKVV